MARLIHELLDAAAMHLPHKTAIITDAGSCTYADLAEQSRRLATQFQAWGVKRSNRVGIVLPNSIPAIVALMASSRIGALFFILDNGLKTYGLRQLLADASPALIITTKALADTIPDTWRTCTIEDDWEQALSSVPISALELGISNDPVCLIYTSGSTSQPKAIISAHCNMIFAAHAIQSCLSIQATDVIGCFLPLSFDYGLYQMLLCFQAGATLALGQPSQVGPALLRQLREWHVTGLPLVPTIASIVIQLARRAPEQLPQLRFITNTGAHLPAALISALQAHLPACCIFVMYGLTECKRVAILPPEDYQRKPDSVGKPLPDTECLIVDADGQLLPAHQRGELIVRGPHVMLGYWQAPELTAQRFRQWGPGLERVLYTGDICSMDAEGYLYFHGRTDDIYKYRDYRVSALEVEAAACDIPGVHMAALIVPDADRGPVLFITGSRSEAEVIEELRQRLEDAKLPEQVLLLEQMPRKTNGKIAKDQLKRYLQERHS